MNCCSSRSIKADSRPGASHWTFKLIGGSWWRIITCTGQKIFIMTEALDMVLQHSCLRRQLAEVEVIRAMYPGEGEFYTTEAEAAALELLDTLDAHTPVPDSLSVSFTLRLLATKVGGRHASVCFSFPRLYPEVEAARVAVECGGHVRKHQHEIMNLTAQAAASEMVGSEAVFLVLQRVQEIAWEIEESAASAPPQSVDTERSHERKSIAKIHRKLMWFHHIKSSQKRKDILDWGMELQLGGFCKPGFPGVLIFEGKVEDVAEYVKRIHGLRWQALQIRGEEEEKAVEIVSQNVDSMRRFPLGIRELPESGMSELAGKCREANLEQLFLTALKISR